MASPACASARASATYRSNLFCGLLEDFERRLCRSDAGVLARLFGAAMSFGRFGLGFCPLSLWERLVLFAIVGLYNSRENLKEARAEITSAETGGIFRHSV